MPVTHDAFISYSHRADSRLATALETGIETLAKPLLRLRACDVFRDETSLAANPSLWTGIADHLGGAGWFVLLACPESAASVWCERETLFWFEQRSLDRLLVVWTGGDLAWDAAREVSIAITSRQAILERNQFGEKATFDHSSRPSPIVGSRVPFWRYRRTSSQTNLHVQLRSHDRCNHA